MLYVKLSSLCFEVVEVEVGVMNVGTSKDRCCGLANWTGKLNAPAFNCTRGSKVLEMPPNVASCFSTTNLQSLLETLQLCLVQVERPRYIVAMQN
jgi:hypothetical protein